MTASAYAQLEDRFRRVGLISGIQAILDWDTATMMPRGGAEARAEQQAAIATLVHREVCEPSLGDLLENAAHERLSAERADNLRAMRHRRAHATAVPERLVEEVNRATALCEMAWRDARPADDFAALLPHLEAVVRLVRERAQAKAAALAMSPYQALLDEHNPGLTDATVRRLFDTIETFLPALVREVRDVQGRRPAPVPLPAPVPADAQRRLGERLMRALGFDFTHGRLDESRHPFMSGSGDDVRITMRTDENDVLCGLFAVIHETGHALYERGLPAAWRWQPGGDAAGSAMHEAQALLWEMQVARGRAFLSYLAPLLTGFFGAPVDAANLARLVQKVEPGMIRVDADECTYPLHVLLRYRLETALFDGRLDVADLPGAWNDAMERLLGIRPRNDGEGCMQDIHWMLGNFGYFPSYALGVTAAAQMVAAARKELGDLDAAIARGEFTGLLGWLRRNVHAHGSLRPIDDLLRGAVGTSFDAAALEVHLRRRYVERAT
ncbi:MAG: carboxypeptidase M32 [Alphaproteobacteria bacterium]|nr:carboxypeptidase M32 [Alphaproteobacteria bacterium]